MTTPVSPTPTPPPLREIPAGLAPRQIDFARSRIPRAIYQTFKTRLVPAGMYAASCSWIERNPTYAYRCFDDAAMLDYVAQFACDGFAFSATELQRALARIRPGAGKADLFRYLLLYDKGGVYMDIDSVCLAPLTGYVAADDDVVSGIGGRGDLHQWGLIYSPRHPFLKRASELAVRNILDKTFIAGFANSLEGIAGPPCLDLAIKQVLGQPPRSRFAPGVTQPSIDGASYKVKILPGDFFGGTVGFKYASYKADLKSLGVSYWMDEALFND